MLLVWIYLLALWSYTHLWLTVCLFLLGLSALLPAYLLTTQLPPCTRAQPASPNWTFGSPETPRCKCLFYLPVTLASLSAQICLSLWCCTVLCVWAMPTHLSHPFSGLLINHPHPEFLNCCLWESSFNLPCLSAYLPELLASEPLWIPVPLQTLTCKRAHIVDTYLQRVWIKVTVNCFSSVCAANGSNHNRLQCTGFTPRNILINIVFHFNLLQTDNPYLVLAHES